MEQHPVVAITEVTGTAEALKKGKGINLGNATLNKQVGGILSRMRDSASKVFHLKWEGDKIPRGAVIKDTEIGWTQNGMVTGTKGEDIGTYERLVEFGGTSGREQQMLVFAW